MIAVDDAFEIKTMEKIDCNQLTCSIIDVEDTIWQPKSFGIMDVFLEGQRLREDWTRFFILRALPYSLSKREGGDG